MKRTIELAIDPIALGLVPAVDYASYQGDEHIDVAFNAGVQVAIVRLHRAHGNVILERERDMNAVDNLRQLRDRPTIGYWYTGVRMDRDPATVANEDWRLALTMQTEAGRTTNLPLMADLEHGDNAGWTVRWLDAYVGALPPQTVLYGPLDMIGKYPNPKIVPYWPLQSATNNQGVLNVPPAQWPSWAADMMVYGVQPKATWMGWQFSSRMTVPGFYAPVDVNVLSYDWCRKTWPDVAFPYRAS